MSSSINWGVRSGDISILQSPLYQRYASTSYNDLVIADIKEDLKGCIASNESAAVVAYLSSLIRVIQLLA